MIYKHKGYLQIHFTLCIPDAIAYGMLPTMP